MNIFEIIGWFGALLFIFAYLLLSFNKIKADKTPYQLMNVLGAICLMINSYKIDDDPNFILNFVWMCIGVIAIMSIIRAKSK
ncbi:CBU_0592 family membrane protein [Hwangdonia seohaensis]|uniref:CBU_0592 family membrane protein n=1 Tax=Hwangdonia seohaensis TaxID=1240727 RepID=UPI0040676F21